MTSASGALLCRISSFTSRNEENEEQDYPLGDSRFLDTRHPLRDQATETGRLEVSESANNCGPAYGQQSRLLTRR